MKAGGLGKAQYYVFVVIMLAFLVKGWIFYGLPYLEKFPDYECKVDE